MVQDFRFWLFFFFWKFERFSSRAQTPPAPPPSWRLFPLERTRAFQLTTFSTTFFGPTSASFTHLCYFLALAAVLSLWPLLNIEAPYEVRITLPFEVFEPRVGRTLAGGWLDSVPLDESDWAPALGIMLLEGLCWFSSNCAVPMGKVVHRVKGTSPPRP